jgi:plastocyanin
VHGKQKRYTAVETSALNYRIMQEQPPQTPTTAGYQHKNLTLLAGLAILIVAISGITAVSNSADRQSTAPVPVALVRITDEGFQPATLAVKPSTKIIWKSADPSLHQVASNPYPSGGVPKNLKSGILSGNRSYTYVADKSGTFTYHDQFNPTNNGTIVVKEQ